MYLTILDLILILVLFLFIAFGFALGLVETIGALVGVILGAWAAGAYYEPMGAWLEPFLLGNGNLARIVAFILVFTIINRLIGLVFWFVNKIFNVVTLIPFTKSLNRFLGAILGLLEGVLVLGLILYFVSRFISADWLISVLASSKMAIILIDISSILTPLLPELLKQLKSVI
ncbi:MAG: CvpA family protein [Candidatus Buchananbacteria bacterium]